MLHGASLVQESPSEKLGKIWQPIFIVSITYNSAHISVNVLHSFDPE